MCPELFTGQPDKILRFSFKDGCGNGVDIQDRQFGIQQNQSVLKRFENFRFLLLSFQQFAGCFPHLFNHGFSGVGDLFIFVKPGGSGHPQMGKLICMQKKIGQILNKSGKPSQKFTDPDQEYEKKAAQDTEKNEQLGLPMPPVKAG